MKASCVFLMVLMALQLLAPGCSDDKEGPTSPAGPSVEELTRGAWTYFETGRYDEALELFDEAVGSDGGFGPAYIGQGWSRLGLAVTSAELQGALTSFNAAEARGEAEVDLNAGRACVLLALGAGRFTQAAAEAQTAQQADSGYVFTHRSTFDMDDLILIEAFALAGNADLAGALRAADRVVESGIDPGSPSTWVVGSDLYTSFEDAVLAYLTHLSDERAG